MPLPQTDDPPPYSVQAQASHGNRSLQCQVSLPSGDGDIAKMLADRSGAPIAAITTAIYAAAYAVPKDKIPKTVTYIADCISIAIRATIAVPQEDREIAGRAFITAITSACNIAASVLPKHIIGGLTDEEQAAAVRVAASFETLNSTSKKMAEKWLRCCISVFVYGVKYFPANKIAAVTAALISAAAESIRTVIEAPAVVQMSLARSFISFGDELTDHKNKGSAFKLPTTSQ